jgi:predicted ATPase
MVGFSAIEIDGYRRLQDVNLKLGPLNVLIGGNGSGKTSLLEVFSLLAASAEGQLGPSISDLGGFQSIATIGRTRSIGLGVSTCHTGNEFKS